MTEVVSEVIAGRLTETRRRRILRGHTYSAVLTRTDGSGSTETTIALDREGQRDVPAGTTHWPPWTRSSGHRG